jgi:predicted MFS family arabinose efflux permease
MALNSAAIYVGQAIGAATGGALLAVSGFSRWRGRHWPGWWWRSC